MQYETIKYKNHFRELGVIKDEDKIYLEKDFVLQSQSIIWDFNKEFWDHLEPFMNALGKDYKKSIGGTADANENLIKYSAQKFAKQLESIALTPLLNKEGSGVFFYLEMGAAGTDWAKEFIAECPNKNFAYVFTDFSKKVLETARHDLGSEFLGVKIEYFCLQNDYFSNEDRIETFKEKYDNKILRVHATNVYDNFPCDRVLFSKGFFYIINVKSYITKESFLFLIDKYTSVGLTELRLLGLLQRLANPPISYMHGETTYIYQVLKEAKDYFSNEKSFYEFWQDLWNMMKFEEQLTPTSVDEKLTKLFNSFKDQEFEFSNSIDVENDILEKYDLLMTGGCIEIIDIIVNDLLEYKNFLGPVKYDASIANYLNGPLLQATLKEKFENVEIQTKSLKDFGGKRNQTIMEINKN